MKITSSLAVEHPEDDGISPAAVFQRKIDRIGRGEPPRVLDIFSGCGGFSLGFKRAGFLIIGGIDINPEAAASQALNFHGRTFPKTKEELYTCASDITQLEPVDLARRLEDIQDHPASAVDVLIGGPPCQAFARVGRAKLRDVRAHPDAYKVDPRSNLYLRYLDYVRDLRPIVLVMENVPDVLNFGGHNMAEETARILEEFGYSCRYTLLNAAFYGVPQMRERMFLIGVHHQLNAEIAFPAPTHHIDLPRGYQTARNFALKNLTRVDVTPRKTKFVQPPPSIDELPRAVTAFEALGDLPPITEHLEGRPKKGPRNLRESTPYLCEAKSEFTRMMRSWEKFASEEMVTAHVIRSLPRDYRIFKEMKPGDEYPQAYRLALRLFEGHIQRLSVDGQAPAAGSTEYQRLMASFVPPYDPDKFPNKWRKMEPDMPARTVMAHMGKDSYSHIHYDSDQARTISVREAARLQSFPDSFQFVGAMNSAFRQIGNAVPPLLAFAIAKEIMAKIIGPITK